MSGLYSCLYSDSFTVCGSGQSYGEIVVNLSDQIQGDIYYTDPLGNEQIDSIYGSNAFIYVRKQVNTPLIKLLKRLTVVKK